MARSFGRARALAAMLALSSLGVALPARHAEAAFGDVPAGHWAAGAIDYVAGRNDWLRNFGPSTFAPSSSLTRRHLARALVLAFAPPASDPEPTASASPAPDPSESASPVPDPTPTSPPGLTFTDVPASDGFYPYVNAAVQAGWLGAPGGTFRPTATVATWELDLALVNALGLQVEVAGLKRISTDNGISFGRSSSWAAMVLAGELRLHYNHSSAYESRELMPWTAVSRAHAAYALHQAALAKGSWRVWSMQRFRTISLPIMTSVRRAVVNYALQYAGYPYVYGGEWYRPTSSGFCCGRQVTGGFDCSGFTWWVLRAPSTGWGPTIVRPYRGWSLPQRTSYDMAKAASPRLVYRDLLPMDLMFFKSDLSRTDWPAIDHVGLYLGNGWLLHSSGGRDGVTISWTGDGWWRDHFVWGRRIIPA